MNGVEGQESLILSSTSSICIFTPPELTVLSHLPIMRNCFLSFTSTRSLVCRVPSWSDGASIVRVELSACEILMPSSGVYHCVVDCPLTLRRAMCESVSVIPYVLHTALGQSLSLFSRLWSMAPPPIMAHLIFWKRLIWPAVWSTWLSGQVYCILWEYQYNPRRIWFYHYW